MATGLAAAAVGPWFAIWIGGFACCHRLRDPAAGICESGRLSLREFDGPRARRCSAERLAGCRCWRRSSLHPAAAGGRQSRRAGGPRPRSPPALRGLGTAPRCRASRSGSAGWSWSLLAALFGEPGPRQAGMGFGAALTAAAFLILLCHGLAGAGLSAAAMPSSSSSIGVVIALIAHLRLLPRLDHPDQRRRGQCSGTFAPAELHRQVHRPLDLGPRLPHRRSCAAASPGTRCSSAVLVGVGTTALGLAFALIATRTGFRLKKLLRVADACCRSSRRPSSSASR